MKRIYYFLLNKLGVSQILENQSKIIGFNEEILKSQIFNSAICDCEWLRIKNVCPSGWAANYNLLYTIFRILNNARPQSILEFGLGQSSKLIHQYANYYNVSAITGEHDAKWISFFENDKRGDYPINILPLEVEMTNFKGYKTRTYKDITELLKGRKFDFIFVDGPIGSEHYSRSQIIDIAKNNLKDSFCIVIDDYERNGEKETTQELMKSLRENNVDFCTAIYRSTREHILICSKDLHFLTSL